MEKAPIDTSRLSCIAGMILGDLRKSLANGIIGATGEIGMSVKDVRRAAAMRRVLEGTVATVAGGAILWCVTSPTSRAVTLPAPTAPSAERLEDHLAPPLQAAVMPQATAMPSSPSPPAPPAREDAAPATAANVTPVSSVAPTLGPVIAVLPPMRTELPNSIPVGSILLYENFLHYREGEATDWGQNTAAKLGLDGRKWLVSYVDGTHPVGRNLRLPNEFYFECRYAAHLPEVTRGLLGWWKEPVSSQISFLNDQGVRYAIEWVVRCGIDMTWHDPLESLYAKKYFHTIRLPSGTAAEVGAIQPTGLLRINRDKNVINVFVNGQLAAAGTISSAGHLVGFEINVVKAKNGTLFFTDFKIAR